MQRKSTGAGRVLGRRVRWGFTASSALAGLLAVGLACRVRPGLPPGPARPFEGVRVQVSCPGDPAAAVVARYSQAWASREGATVEVVRYRPEEGPAKGPPADVWVVSPARMPHWAAADQLHPLPQTYTARGAGYAWDDLLPLYRYKLLVWDGQVYALPLLGDALLCFYRSDLVEDPQHRAAFRQKYGRELAPPDTWEEFAQVAEYFHNRKRPGMPRPGPSLPPLPADNDALDRLFYAVAVPFGHRAVRESETVPEAEVFSFHYDLESGAVRIDTPGFVHALTVLQRLQAYRPAGPSAEPPASFEKGEAVLCLAAAAWIKRFRESPALRGKFSFRRPPGSQHVFDYHTGLERAIPGGNHVPYLGADGWVAVVPRTSPRPDAAFSLLTFLSDPKTSGGIVIEPAWGGGVFRRSQLDNRDGWQAFDLSPEQTALLLESLRQTVLHTDLINPVVRLRTPDERVHQRALDEEVRAALAGGKPAAAALAAAAQRWRELDAGKPLQARLRDYRLSLSLGRGD